MEQIRWMAYWTFRFHSRIVPSSLPLASVCPSGLNATESTADAAAGQGLAERAGLRGIGDIPQPDRAAAVAAGQRAPSGLNATESTAAVRRSGAGRAGGDACGSATSHSRTVPSSSPLASVCPSGLNATELMAASVAAGQDRAERAGVRGIGDIPQPDRAAVVAAAGQRVPIGAERHRAERGTCRRSGPGRSAGDARDRRYPTAGPRRRCRRWPACARRG